MNHRILTLSLSAACLALAGCVEVSETGRSATDAVVTGHEGGAYEARNTDRYDLENKDRVALMDKAVQVSVTYSGLRERFLDDGRLEVFAKIRNRESRRLEVQIDCVFKDAQGFSTGDETPFQSLILTENSQEEVHFVAMNKLAKNYTIRIREAH